MSYDRVLPKPLPLLYDTPPLPFPRRPCNLLGSPIMNSETSAKVSLVNHPVDKITSSLPVGSLKSSLPALTNASQDWVKQICLCQRSPKVPRPRNGTSFLLFVWPRDDEKPQPSSYIGNITKPQWWLGIQALGTPISPGSLESNGESCLSIQRIDGMLMPRYAA
jgi:hypothetical protein